LSLGALSSPANYRSPPLYYFRHNKIEKLAWCLATANLGLG